MSSPNNFCYQVSWGFVTCNVDDDVPPTDFVARWGVNQDQADLIADGGVIEVVDGKLVVSVPEVEG